MATSWYISQTIGLAELQYPLVEEVWEIYGRFMRTFDPFKPELAVNKVVLTMSF